MKLLIPSLLKNKVSTCLKIFGNKAVAALQIYAALHALPAEGTILFLKLVI